MRKIYELEFGEDRLFFANFDIGRKFLESKGYKMLLIDRSYSYPWFSLNENSGTIDWNRAQSDYDDFIFDAKNIHLWDFENQSQKMGLFYKSFKDFVYSRSCQCLIEQFTYESVNDL